MGRTKARRDVEASDSLVDIEVPSPGKSRFVDALLPISHPSVPKVMTFRKEYRNNTLGSVAGSMVSSCEDTEGL